MNRHFFPAGIILALALLAIATYNYPGGSQSNVTRVGFDWKDNYICNLFGATAVNGAVNSGRPWAIAGMFVLCSTVALFFFGFSTRIGPKGAARVIRYCGMIGMSAAFLATTPLHDYAITTALVFSMIAVLYITIFVFMSRMNYQKVLAGFTMLSTYTAAYLYYTRTALELLPTMQKVSLAALLIWLLTLHYFTTKEDFVRSAPRAKS